MVETLTLIFSVTVAAVNLSFCRNIEADEPYGRSGPKSTGIDN